MSSSDISRSFLSRRQLVAFFALASASATAALAPAQAFAQSEAPANWPNQSVRLIVPAPAGSTTDALARMLDINGTPGFVIGDHIEPGAVETAVLQEIVNEQRVAARTRK